MPSSVPGRTFRIGKNTAPAVLNADRLEKIEFSQSAENRGRGRCTHTYRARQVECIDIFASADEEDAIDYNKRRSTALGTR